ncbi:juvenile hormone acid O-methyltransferase-like [Ptychodera flava]|uniref:juvenile hormone acid O-methyltransferase-like n=1 Tax=Ptychodera flava TaxID=63121 RepID=UPI00396A8D3F
MNVNQLKTFTPIAHTSALSFMEELSKALSLDQKDVSLDVGCGVGTLTRLLSERVGRVTAFDISLEMIKEAKEISTAGNITYSVGDATKLSTYEEYTNSFDKVVAHFALHWMKDFKTALEGIHQSLKPGGQCYLDMGQHNPDIIDTIKVLNSYTSPKWETYMKGYEHAYYTFKGSVDDYKQMLASIGFKDIDCKQERFKLPLTNDEGKAFLPNFMGQLERFPEDRREEYMKDALTFAFGTDQGEFFISGSLITAIARR